MISSDFQNIKIYTTRKKFKFKKKVTAIIVIRNNHHIQINIWQVKARPAMEVEA